MDLEGEREEQIAERPDVHLGVDPMSAVEVKHFRRPIHRRSEARYDVLLVQALLQVQTAGSAG
eukprot:scaffold125916_cov26-Tisochrysis_lutea.AAC.4